MPIYEYLCSACDAKFETFARSWTDKASCPECASDSVEKQLSSFAFTGGDGGSVAATASSCCGRGGCGCSH